MNLKNGYVIGYDPKTATIDIRTADGTTYNNVHYLPSLGVYPTPIVSTLNSDGSIKKFGSNVIFYEEDDLIYAIAIYNDDLDLSRYLNVTSKRIGSAIVQEPLYQLLQEGECLLAAPGRHINKNSNPQRQPGSWILLKNTGDALFSNADMSAQIILDTDGKFYVNAIEYVLQGLNTSVYEKDGNLTLVNKNATISIEEEHIELTTPDAIISISDSELSIKSNSVIFSATDSMIIQSPGLKIDGFKFDLVSNDFNILTENFILNTTLFDISTGSMNLNSVNNITINTTGEETAIYLNGNQSLAFKSALEELKSQFDNFVQSFNTHVHGGVLSGGSSTLVPTAVQTEDLTQPIGTEKVFGS